MAVANRGDASSNAPRLLSVIACAALLAACASAPRERPPVIPAPSPLFEFRSDFWVNLHHFLYARSRVRQGMDARRPALLHVAADTAGFGALPDDARRGWERALAVYDTVLSRRDITFDSAAVELAYALAGRGAEPLDAAWWRASPLRERVRAALEDAAPAYRAALWARHDSANRAWVAEHDALLRQYADTLARQLARTYRWPWPGEPIPVEVVAFAQWAGAYAVEHPSLLTLQSVYELHRGTLGLEQLFHEASHLLMDSVDAAMRRAAEARGRRYRDVGGFEASHALLFYTAGEVVRRTVPAHTQTVAEWRRMWEPGGGFARYHAALVAHWRPYLDGRATFEQAIEGYVAALDSAAPPPGARTGAAPPLFEMHSGFWVNLHNFLYMQARARGGLDRDAPEAARAASDSAGFGRMPAAQQAAWEAARTYYARTLARRNPTFDSLHIRIKTELAAREDRPSPGGAPLDPALVALLEGAAPAYRSLWWPRHDAANRAWSDSVAPLLARHGSALAADLARLYRMPWPSAPIRVDLSAHTKVNGAYTTTRPPHIVMTSTDDAYRGARALEMLFHEASHTMDDSLTAALERAWPAGAGRPPYDLVHTIIFYTAGELVRRRIPGYVPYAEHTGLWERSRSFARFLPAVRAHWRPYLDGRTTLEEAARALAP